MFPLQVTMKTALGQTLDLLSSPTGTGSRPLLEHFTMDRYNAIVRNKTGYYSFYLPVALAMHMVSKRHLTVMGYVGNTRSVKGSD